MEKVGEIFRNGREIYLVIEADGEAYYFEGGAFHQGLTRSATKGCKIKDIEELIPPDFSD